jgi:quercetin dioxygenase-like cupin family protein
MINSKNKYFSGKLTDFKDTRGWFIGSFFPDDHPCKTDKVEILYTSHNKGHICKKHYHQEKIEVNIIIKGKANYWINDKLIEVKAGEFIFIDVNNTIKGEFIENTELISIHSPSIPNDKVIAEE